MIEDRTQAGASTVEAYGASTDRAVESTRSLRLELEAADKVGRRFASSLVGAFEGLAFKGKSLGDVVKSLALNLSHVVLRSAFAPLEKGIGSLVSSALGGALAFSHGGALQRGNVIPFAAGGVISSPMTFPLAGGRMGLAGERGAEAIMPLTRGRDGRLGIVAQGGGAGPSITVNISTPDIDSFQKSQTQVAAMIARAAALGQRNL